MTGGLHKSGIDLLYVLDALVKRGQGPAGIVGTLSIGVKTEAGEEWWHVRFSPLLTTEFLDTRPKDTDAWVLLSDAQANAIMDQGVLPSGENVPTVWGDQRLFERFAGRYLKKQSERDIRNWGV